MATIANLSNGKYKAIIKKKGRILKTKTFIRKRDAQTWARRIEADREELEALGSSGAKITFHELVDEYMRQWKDPNQTGRVMF